MNQDIFLTLIEFVASVLIEGIILTMVFQWLANKQNEKQQQNIAQEMNNIEKQNKFIFEQLQNEIRGIKTDIMNQVKESSKNTNKGANPK